MARNLHNLPLSPLIPNDLPAMALQAITFPLSFFVLPESMRTVRASFSMAGPHPMQSVTVTENVRKEAE